MNIKKILIPLMALLIAVPGLANEKMKYKNPTGKEFPILKKDWQHAKARE